MNDFSLLIILVPFGRATKIVRYAKEKGLTGATIMIAFGTVKSKLLDFLGIQETRKELILTAGNGEFLDGLMDELNKKFNLTRKNFGIAFRMPLSFINIENTLDDEKPVFKREEVKTMKSAIFTVVNRGKANEVVDASLEAGARGGTIIHARGSGLNQTKLIFDMEIEPEKEIVLTIVDDEQLDNVVEAIRKNSDVEKDGHGILFVIPISKAYGIK
ncbi:P-II family nitrogen regulator [Treponema sp. OMZ 788]|uniref:P-II family nitrogen regulator n=1 Tax=unclassified Treponema TaxID=2638727 RepID=UPI0020A544F0|nr:MULTISPECIES: P-II family nitrogen regulator [unclassified Treponema]UTC62556.1 P-II family nitrogen regulator [Treponema sp. OMZ 787]UTC64482.1 P-II family nitrogen regulator [Treponema sp. OMZ 788]